MKYLEGLGKAAEAKNGITVHFLIKPKGEDGQAQAEELLRALQPEGTSGVVGTLPKARSCHSLGTCRQEGSCKQLLAAQLCFCLVKATMPAIQHAWLPEQCRLFDNELLKAHKGRHEKVTAAKIS